LVFSASVAISGVPVKAMKAALGNARRMFAASTAYCERCASSVMTMMSERSESFGKVSPWAVPNFWMRVKT
jgi:hypothetical protein